MIGQDKPHPKHREFRQVLRRTNHILSTTLGWLHGFPISDGRGWLPLDSDASVIEEPPTPFELSRRRLADSHRGFTRITQQNRKAFTQAVENHKQWELAAEYVLAATGDLVHNQQPLPTDACDFTGYRPATIANVRSVHRRHPNLVWLVNDLTWTHLAKPDELSTSLECVVHICDVLDRYCPNPSESPPLDRRLDAHLLMRIALENGGELPGYLAALHDYPAEAIQSFPTYANALASALRQLGNGTDHEDPQKPRYYDVSHVISNHLRMLQTVQLKDRLFIYDIADTIHELTDEAITQFLVNSETRNGAAVYDVVRTDQATSQPNPHRKHLQAVATELEQLAKIIDAQYDPLTITTHLLRAAKNVTKDRDTFIELLKTAPRKLGERRPGIEFYLRWTSGNTSKASRTQLERELHALQHRGKPDWLPAVLDTKLASDNCIHTLLENYVRPERRVEALTGLRSAVRYWEEEFFVLIDAGLNASTANAVLEICFKGAWFPIQPGPFLQRVLQITQTPNQIAQLLKLSSSVGQRSAAISLQLTDQGLKSVGLQVEGLLDSAAETKVLEQVFVTLKGLHDLEKTHPPFPDLPEPNVDRLELQELAPWVLDYPEELHPAMVLHSYVGTEPEQTTKSIFDKEVADKTGLQTQIDAIGKLLSEAGSTQPNDSRSAHLEQRRTTLQRRLQNGATDKQIKKVERRLNQRSVAAIAKHWVRAMRRVWLGALADELGHEVPKEVFDLQMTRSVMRLREPYRKLGLQILMDSHTSEPFDPLRFDANRRFVERMTGLGLNMEPWLHPGKAKTITVQTIKKSKLDESQPIPSSSLSPPDRLSPSTRASRRHPKRRSPSNRQTDLEGSESQPIEVQLTVRLETDPMEILKMGQPFGTCLSPGDFNFWSAVVNAVDINKAVLFGRLSNGRVVARCLLALDNQGHLLAYHPYAHEPSWNFRQIVADFVDGLAQRIGTSPAAGGTTAAVVTPDWYDDGAQDLFGHAATFKPDSPFMKSFVAMNTAEALQALEKLPFNPYRHLKNILLDGDYNLRPDVFIALFKRMPPDVQMVDSEWMTLAKKAIIQNERAIANDIVRGKVLPTTTPWTSVAVWKDLAEHAPSATIRRLRKTRPDDVTSDLEDLQPRREALAIAHRKLGRSVLATKLEQQDDPNT